MRWRTIPISLMGWIATLKMMAQPRINYLFSMFPTQPPIFTLKSLNTNISKFLWRNKPSHISLFCKKPSGGFRTTKQPTSHGLTMSKLTVKTFKCLTSHSSARPSNTTTAWLWEEMGRGALRIGDFGRWISCQSALIVAPWRASFCATLIFSMSYLDNPTSSSLKLEKLSWEKWRLQTLKEGSCQGRRPHATTGNLWKPLKYGGALAARNTTGPSLATSKQ